MAHSLERRNSSFPQLQSAEKADCAADGQRSDLQSQTQIQTQTLVDSNGKGRTLLIPIPAPSETRPDPGHQSAPRRASAPEPLTKLRGAGGAKCPSVWNLEYRKGNTSREPGGVPCNVILYAGDRRGTIISAKAAATINHHYYPEGGWGWVVAVAAALVHFLTCGLQWGAFGLVSANLSLHFRPPKAGKNFPPPDEALVFLKAGE